MTRLSRQLDRARCQSCGKWTFPTRKAARHAARAVHPNDPKLQAYPCPQRDDGHAWHYGHRREALDVT